MSEILGHDCDGRELRAGDRVEIVNSVSGRCIGMKTTACRLVPSIDPVTMETGEAVQTDIPRLSNPCGFHVVRSGYLRLINSGRELFDKCAREADKIPSEQKVLESAPWTEPAGEES